MLNSIRIKKRGKLKYYSTEIPLDLRLPGEGRKEIMATSRDELREKYDEEIEKRRKGLDRNAGKLSLEEFLKTKFLEHAKSDGGIELQTFNDYRFHVETNIIPLIGEVQLDKVTMRDVDQWMVALRQRVSTRTGKPLSDRTIEYAYAVLRRSLQFAVDWRYIATNPASARMRMAKRKKRVKTTKLQFFKPAEATKFLDVVSGDKYEALYVLAITTGMREGELFGLKWEDVNLDEGRLTVNHSLAHTKRKKSEQGERVVLKGPKTVGSRRTIEIPEIAVTSLHKHASLQAEMKCAAGADWTEEDFVFTSRVGTYLDRGNALHRFQDICAENELPKIRFYDLRHTHASLLISEGVHAKKIAERLGHSSIKLTMDTYGHLFEGSDRESAARMDKLFGRKKPEEPETVKETKKEDASGLLLVVSGKKAS